MDDTSAPGWSIGQGLYRNRTNPGDWFIDAASPNNKIYLRINGLPPVNQPSEVRAYWTDSDTPGSNRQNTCERNEPFRAFWLPPVESRSETGATTYKIASDWEAEVTPSRGASNASYSITNTDGNPEYPELTGTVDIDGLSTLGIRVRGMFDNEWGDWSKSTTMVCGIGGL